MKIIGPEYCTGIEEGWYASFNFNEIGPFRTKAEAERTISQIKEILNGANKLLVAEVEGVLKCK